MTESGPPVVTPPLSTLKQKKRKVFYEHGKDSLELAVSIGKTQEDKALLKAERHHQPQVGWSAPIRAYTSKKQDKKEIGKSSKTEEVKATIANQRARLKREKIKKRKERPVPAVHQKSSPSSNAQDRAPRKRVSFA
ncbi:hypothetical protein F4604DRAFT_1683192 [Suillus subluteus]|nr:hypothetical protein F4604DRAFT_1683192 [Suillus subluteus]